MKFNLDTDHPVALDSNDYLHPLGAKQDNYENPMFNQLLFGLFNGNKPTVLDFGCAGGAMVRSLIDDGCLAIGLEGSDYGLVTQTHEWGVIPDNLLTCDLSFPFILSNEDSEPFKFDVITAWEFVEHLSEERLPVMIDNMRRHLKARGFVIGSSTDWDSQFRKIIYHPTRHKLDWWEDLFKSHGFMHRTDLLERFDKAEAWVRRHDFNFVFQMIR
jgi:cyclopropane fatty-acyl-phospholipid synthase-like methyltransferase